MRPVHSHSWVWAVLPPDCVSVQVHDDPELGAVLREAGLLLSGSSLTGSVAAAARHSPHHGSGTGEGRRALLLTGPTARGHRLPRDDVVAVAVDAWPELAHPAATHGRVLRRLASPLALVVARLRVRRAVQALSAAGLRPVVLPTGDRDYQHVLGPGRWPGVRRLPVAAVVVGSKTGPVESTLDVATRQAAEATGLRLLRRCAVVTESGKILQRLEDADGHAYLQRLGGGPSHALVQRSVTNAALLRRADPPPAVAGRVPWPIADGSAGAVRWSLESFHPGASPPRMTSELWKEAVDFCVALSRLGDRGRAGEPEHWAPVAGALRTVASRLPADDAAALHALGARLQDVVGDVPVGWSHGDLWPENLLVRDGHLSTVLDWEWARPGALPLGDLLDLLALSRGRRQEGVGARTTGPVWRLLEGSDHRVTAYCAAVGLPTRPRVLHGLAVACWLDRVARDLAPFRSNSVRDGWMIENVQRPLHFFLRQGWS